MTVAPRAAASFTPAPRSDMSALLTSTRMILQLGQAALAMSRSSEISVAHPLSAVGYEPCTPLWLTFLKQPFAVVHAGRPYCAR
jgi:hypothetical protein